MKEQMEKYGTRIEEEEQISWQWGEVNLLVFAC